MASNGQFTLGKNWWIHLHFWPCSNPWVCLSNIRHICIFRSVFLRVSDSSMWTSVCTLACFELPLEGWIKYFEFHWIEMYLCVIAKLPLENKVRYLTEQKALHFVVRGSLQETSCSCCDCKHDALNGWRGGVLYHFTLSNSVKLKGNVSGVHGHFLR